ncbi:MAG TPA: MFS transporter [Bacteroidales bacterium]|nr:MFS transporter [Bacteroidales bacterium]HPB25758.1 MFS transporter [Bacteroidales bacterium]HPI31489.1 MFS transporter [Bacteroidales bacterium]HQN16604.1 MFS transporter [Bacteroidales bacterium]HQP15850.1 MFS transporter [Bacteroidales bacterium]
MNERIWSRNFIFLILSNFLMYVTYYAILSALPLYLVNDLEASEMQVGIVVGAYTIAAVLVRPFSGFALDRFGRRVVFLIALVIYSFLFAGYLVALSITAILMLRFAQGLTWGFTTVSGSTVAADIIPATKRGQGIGYFALSTTIGMSVGPVIGLFICQQWGFIVVFLASCIISLMSLACAWAIQMRKRFVVGKRMTFHWNILFDKKSLRPSANVFITMIAYGSMLSFVALYGQELGVKNASLYFLFLSAGIAIARLTSGKEFDRHGPRRIITVCIALLIIGFPMLALAKNAVLYFFSAIIIGFGNGVIFPTFQSIVNNLANSTHRGAANSTLYTAVDLGMGLGMVMSGLIAQKISLSAIFWVSALVCAAGLLFFRFVVLGFYERRYR